MSLMPRYQPQPRFLSPLKEEWRHWVDMPPQRLCLLLLSSILRLFRSPLLPIAAYALQLWASHSWAWRDRWASVTSWAKQGSMLVTIVFLVAVLNAAQVWIVPYLTAALQAFWRAHLPGDLSLSPTDPDALLARMLLFLPLVPALAVWYEWLGPRTPVQPQRVLTPADLVEPTKQAVPPPSSPTPPARPKAPPKVKAAPSAPATKQKRQRTSGPPRQMTIESFLSSAPVAPPVEKQTEPPAATQPPTAPDIDWDDVAE